MKYLTLSLLISLLSAHFSLQACTGLSLRAKDGAYIQARTIEWGESYLPSEYVIIPRGRQIKTYTPAGLNGAIFQTKYGVAGLAIIQKEFIAEGLNEAGLSAGLFYFPRYGNYSAYDPAENHRTVNDLQLVTWMLAQFSSVDEVKTALPSIRIIGLDLKEDVIEHCDALARDYGYDKLKFLTGDIASYTGEDRVDMVVTLHACDTATDFALEKAVRWGAKVILSVPCCQHELNRQIHQEVLEPVLKYGLIRERMAALVTDALRAGVLEEQGYEVQILEFIDMEHTPKNILIRAVKGSRKGKSPELKACMEFLGVDPTLKRLLDDKRG